MAKTLLALFNLKDGVDAETYVEWAKSIDIPTVNGLRSIDTFKVFSVEGLFGSEDKAPYQYFEIIQVNEMDGFLTDVGSAKMQKVAGEFQNFTDDVFFMVSNEVV